MKSYDHKPENASRIFGTKLKTAKQPPIDVILRKYDERRHTIIKPKSKGLSDTMETGIIHRESPQPIEKQHNTIHSSSRTGNGSIQMKPVPTAAEKTGTGDWYNDDFITNISFKKIKDNTFLLDENKIISWDGSQYITKDGAPYDLSTHVAPSEKVLMIGMSEYGNLKNDDSAYTHLESFGACPCFILILRSKTNTAMYHITYKNEFTCKDFYQFIDCPKDDENEYKDEEIDSDFINEKGIKAFMYQGEYDSDKQTIAKNYMSLGMDKFSFLPSLSRENQEYAIQAEKFEKAKKILTDNCVPPVIEKIDCAKIKLSDGVITNSDLSSPDLGNLITQRGLKFGMTSTTLIPRNSNVQPNDDYSSI